MGHTRVIENYHIAHEMAVRDSHGEATTEDLRQAMVCYRALFEELLGTRVIEGEREEVRSHG